jgi:hypothetical protein
LETKRIWDEISVVEGSALWRIQNGEQLHEGRVEFMIAGSRPEAVKNILDVKKDSVLLVQGFTDDGIWRFVRTYFGEQEVAAKPLQDRSKGEVVAAIVGAKRDGDCTLLIRSSLKSGWLWDACHSPLKLRFVCLVAPQLAKLDRVNRTAVYKLVVDHFMNRVVQGKLRRKVREQLAEIAWNGYSSGNLLVSEDDLMSWSHFEHLTRCGLLRSEGAIGTESNVFSWAHFTIQEYLAAEHVCSDRFKGLGEGAATMLEV